MNNSNGESFLRFSVPGCKFKTDFLVWISPWRNFWLGFSIG